MTPLRARKLGGNEGEEVSVETMVDRLDADMAEKANRDDADQRVPQLEYLRLATVGLSLGGTGRIRSMRTNGLFLTSDGLGVHSDLGALKPAFRNTDNDDPKNRPRSI